MSPHLSRLQADSFSSLRMSTGGPNSMRPAPSASNSSKRVGAGCEDVLLMRLSGLVSQRIEEDVRE